MSAKFAHLHVHTAYSALASTVHIEDLFKKAKEFGLPAVAMTDHGNMFGAIGQKGGVGVGNLLNAISLVLNRFVNHDSPISGHVDISGGVLSDRSLIVQGNKATANIRTRTNLAASSTDTTIDFTIAEDTSAPYLITTIRGPTSNLSYNVVRGTAKDPPGMINTLTGGGSGGGSAPQQQQQQRSPIPGLPIPNIFGR